MSGRRFETATGPATAGPDPARQAGQTRAWRPGPPPPGGATADGHRRLDPAGALLLRLQREYGNRYVQRVVALGRQGGPASGIPVPQAKLALGPPRDRYEREADQVARRVVARSAEDGPGPWVGTGRADEPAARPPDIQLLHGSPAGVVDATVERDVGKARGGGQAVPDALRSRAEQALGADLGAVRVHTGARVDRLNEALRSHAFTVGSDVFVHRSRYRPGTRAGDELLAHELTHTVQQGAATAPGCGSGPPAPAVPTVQRDFGFELELSVLLTSDGPGGIGKREPVSDPKKVVGRSTDPQDFEMHVDHSKTVRTLLLEGSQLRDSPPILELVTKPMDEFAVGENRVRTLMGRLVATANSIKTNAIDANDRIALDDVAGVTAVPAQTNYVGSEKDIDAENRVQSVDAMVQQTYGVSLRRVTQEFSNRLSEEGSWIKNPMAAPGWTTQQEYEKTRQALASANSQAASTRGWITSQFGTGFSAEEASGVEGLFALILYYLHRGRVAEEGGLIKKKVGLFFYKTKLSTVRDNLAADIPGLRALLDDQATRATIATRLLKLANRTAAGDDEVITGAGISCKDWLDEVLAGRDDTVFEKARNDWSSELRADRIGKGSAAAPGVVLENREFAATQGRKEAQRYAPGEWADMAVKLWQRLRDLQGAPNG
jgi:hypothetical protein